MKKEVNNKTSDKFFFYILTIIVISTAGVTSLGSFVAITLCAVTCPFFFLLSGTLAVTTSNN